jgi:hypothetical protein
MKETLRFTSYSSSQRPAFTAEVEYVERDHYLKDVGHPNRDGRPWKAYDVLVDGVEVGYIEQVTASTDRKPSSGSRIRIPGRGRTEWSWHIPHGLPAQAGRRDHYPGLYGRSRRAAVADMLAYARAEKV